jgi:uncharacterized protein YydD (DUF2326 family)
MATLKLKADINELKNIEQELKRLNELMKPLRIRKKEIESNILKFMETSNNNQGIAAIKMSDVEVVAVEKKTREKLHKEEKEQHAIQLLKNSGIQNASKVYNDLQELMKGKEHTQNKLKFKDNSQSSNNSSSIIATNEFKLPKPTTNNLTGSKVSKAAATSLTNIPIPNFVHPSQMIRSNPYK